MKIKLTILAFLQMLAVDLIAQNIGIGTAEPQNKLQVQGSLLVTTPTTATNTAPNVPQTKTMVNASTITFLNTDSTGRIYDPGGPGGNYIPNLLAFANIDYFPFNSIGIEITAETMGLGTGDSLIIKESINSPNNLLAVGNGYTTTGKWVFNGNELYIIFKSNADASTGIGFSLLFKGLYDNSISLPDVSGATGYALLFDSKNGYFRSGVLSNNPKGIFSTATGYQTTANGFVSTAIGFQTTASGDYSTAIGLQTTASGSSSTATGNQTTASGSSSTVMGLGSTASGAYSTAIGYYTTANGIYSTAMGKYTDATGYASTAIGDSSLASGSISFASGFRTTASGLRSTAMGSITTASGDYSTAIGYNTISTGIYSTAMGLNTNATGNNSTAMGYNTTASGLRSTAMGNHVSTNNQEGCFVIGDNSTLTVMNSPAINNFRARFANGYRLYTSADYSTGCSLGAGDNAWTTGSDVHTKENFAEVNGEDFLKKISGFHLTSWNYKKQNPATFRHYGPMAQDFYAAFGKDKYGTIGNDTTINSADFAGVSFIAIQALEKRTQAMEELRKENELLKKNYDILKEMFQQLRKELDELKEANSKNL